MSPTKSFLKNYLPTARSVITHPRQFFRDMPTSGPLKEPLAFAVLTIFIVSLLYMPINLLSWAPLLSPNSDMVLTLIIMAAMFLYTLFTMLISIPINSILYHILLKIFGAKGSLEATLRVFCYYLAISLVILPVAAAIVIIFYLAEVTGANGILFQILVVVLMLAMTIPIIYSFYVLFVGFSEVHQISMIRVFLALLIIPIALFLILAALVVGLVFIANYSTFMGTMPPPGDYPYTGYGQPYTSPVIPNITAVYGTPPMVDGHYSFDQDKWYETQEIDFISRDVPYTIAAKHDSQNLYILLKWEGGPQWENSMDIRLELDGTTHDHDLSTGRDDYKYNGAEVYGPGNLADANYANGVAEEHNGMVAGNYSGGMWVQEWVIPLDYDDPGDIYVEQLPTTLGFAVIDWGPGVATGVWPPGAWPYEPETWGDLELLE